ncbi:putative protein [Arabidopsis thaliana]|nr:putative protein [Arabidopsis thaliana]CAB80619.1 putative protein [Arabidopsis thaliana]
MKKKTTTSPILSPTPHSTQILSLPVDLLISILARVSRLDYPILSLVSKSFRSLIASPELYETRSLLGRTESCLYLCLGIPSDFNPRWFTLCRKPKPSGHVMAAISIPNSRPVHCSGLVAVGSDIYNIGGSIINEHSSSVSILDCRYHTWRDAPNMLVERNSHAANVIDGKIYVAGGSRDSNSSNWMEVFDIKTQTWEPVLNPIADGCDRRIRKSAVIEEAICLFGYKGVGVAYNPRIDKWEAIGEVNYLDLGWIGCWMKLKGLEGLPEFASYSYVRLADYGGKMAVLWDKLPTTGNNNMVIWCAVITLEKRHNENIWGRVEWFDAVLTVPEPYEFVCARSANV